MATKKPAPKLKLRRVKPTNSAAKSKMKRSFAKWNRSAAASKYKRAMANPTLKRRHMQDRIKKIQGWIVKLKASKDPNRVVKIYNHNQRIKYIKEKLRLL